MRRRGSLARSRFFLSLSLSQTCRLCFLFSLRLCTPRPKSSVSRFSKTGALAKRRAEGGIERDDFFGEFAPHRRPRFQVRRPKAAKNFVPFLSLEHDKKTVRVRSGVAAWNASRLKKRFAEISGTKELDVDHPIDRRRNRSEDLVGFRSGNFLESRAQTAGAGKKGRLRLLDSRMRFGSYICWARREATGARS